MNIGRKRRRLSRYTRASFQGKEDYLLRATCGEYIRYRLEAGTGRLPVCA